MQRNPRHICLFFTKLYLHFVKFKHSCPWSGTTEAQGSCHSSWHATLHARPMSETLLKATGSAAEQGNAELETEVATERSATLGAIKLAPSVPDSKSRVLKQRDEDVFWDSAKATRR